MFPNVVGTKKALSGETMHQSLSAPHLPSPSPLSKGRIRKRKKSFREVQTSLQPGERHVHCRLHFRALSSKNTTVTTFKYI
jgi:hypothetical protein